MSERKTLFHHSLLLTHGTTLDFMASSTATVDFSRFHTPTKKKCSTSPLSSPSSISTSSTHSKQRSITDNSNDETITNIKMEEGNDEVKVFSASTLKKHEPDDDIDVDGIEDRLSPVIVEPVSTHVNHHESLISLSLFLSRVQTRMIR